MADDDEKGEDVVGNDEETVNEKKIHKDGQKADYNNKSKITMKVKLLMRIENKLEMCRMVKMRKNRLMKRKEIQKKVEEYQNRTFKADNEKYNLEPEAEEDEEMIDRLSEKNYSEKYDTDEETNSESENNDNEDVIKVERRPEHF